MIVFALFFVLYNVHCTECYITCMISICVFTFYNFHILFCVWMLGSNSWWSAIALYMNTSCFTAGYSDMFLRWISVWWCDLGSKWHLFLDVCTFVNFGGILCMCAYIIWYWSYLYECFTGILYMLIIQLWHIVCNHDHCNSSL